jgi:tRNA A-37 threonylcarbamoyl transferase component Bud32
VPAPQLRLRVASPGLIRLPWELPLASWNIPDVPLRDIAVGPSRHLVKFVEADGALWAVKELPSPIAAREYEVLRRLEVMGLNAVRPAGLVVQPENGNSLLVTRYLEGSWQYRRLFLRLPPDQPKQRGRLYDAMATLMVELHRHGVFWGDCSLANTLFSRDGQQLQAWFVDAETSEVHDRLSDGQRAHDLEILVENVAGGLVDLAARLGRPPRLYAELIDEADGIRDRYTGLWNTLHAAPVFEFGDRYRVEGTIRRLNELGFAVEEVVLSAPSRAQPERLRLNVTVGDRRFNSDQLRRLSGLEVGDGQAQILLGDLRAYQVQLGEETGEDVEDSVAGQLWLREVVLPTMHRAHRAVHGRGTPIQAYCDLLEVRWLLSERAGRDVGTVAALAALARDHVPADSAAGLAVVETPTAPMPRVRGDR